MDDTFHFNSFEIRRRAHTASRRDTTQSWNPFRHFSWQGPPHLAPGDDDDASNLEAQHAASHRSATTPVIPSGWDPKTPPGEQNRELSQDAAVTSSQPDTALGSFSATGDDSASFRIRKNQKLEQNAPDPDTGPEPELRKERTGIFRHVQPKAPFTVANQLQRTLLSSWINLLIFAAPVGIALNYIPATKGVAVFVVNFIAIIPLAAMLSFATEEIALRTGETLGGLLNATFGNAVELIIAVIALKQGKITIVQTSLIGSILSNLLLVLGCCFFFGGLTRREQFFNTTAAQTASSLLILAVGAVIVPTVFNAQPHTELNAVAPISRGAAIILLLVYAGYLLFQLKTHQKIISLEGQKSESVKWMKRRRGRDAGVIGRSIASSGRFAAYGTDRSAVATENSRMSAMMHNAPRVADLHKRTDASADDDDDDDEGPQLHFLVAVATLTGATVIIAVCAEFMVGGIDAVTKSVSEEFVGLILLPVVGNAAEHATAVTVALKDKMDLAIGVAVGSSMQVALFLIPLVVVIGWGLQIEEMTLSFDIFQVAVLFVSVLLVNYLIADGKSHWLEGFLLICLYAIIAVCSFWYPNTNAVG